MAYEADMAANRAKQAEANRKTAALIVRAAAGSLLGILLLVGLSMWGCPVYSVWEQGLVGQAELRRAEQNRQIAIQVAQATEQSAEHLKQAEITRAEGVAQANKIIGSSLHENEDYLLYLWIHNLAEAEKNGAEVIYVPTEANLPILEAGRRFRPEANQSGK
jgi:regulator of protease activity HflC (stomatin/prohibitin superfamily)